MSRVILDAHRAIDVLHTSVGIFGKSFWERYTERELIEKPEKLTEPEELPKKRTITMASNPESPFLNKKIEKEEGKDGVWWVVNAQQYNDAKFLQPSLKRISMVNSDITPTGITGGVARTTFAVYLREKNTLVQKIRLNNKYMQGDVSLGLSRKPENVLGIFGPADLFFCVAQLTEKSDDANLNYLRVWFINMPQNGFKVSTGDIYPIPLRGKDSSMDRYAIDLAKDYELYDIKFVKKTRKTSDQLSVTVGRMKEGKQVALTKTVNFEKEEKKKK